MREHPKLTGDRTTLAVMLALIDAGLDVSVPFGENCRYDLVIDRAGRLTRVQCKTGRLRDGVVRFATASTYGHLPSPRETRRDYVGEIDEFAVYCPGTGRRVSAFRSRTWSHEPAPTSASLPHRTASASESATRRTTRSPGSSASHRAPHADSALRRTHARALAASAVTHLRFEHPHRAATAESPR